MKFIFIINEQNTLVQTLRIKSDHYTFLSNLSQFKKKLELNKPIQVFFNEKLLNDEVEKLLLNRETPSLDFSHLDAEFIKSCYVEKIFNNISYNLLVGDSDYLIIVLINVISELKSKPNGKLFFLPSTTLNLQTLNENSGIKICID